MLPLYRETHEIRTVHRLAIKLIDAMRSVRSVTTEFVADVVVADGHLDGTTAFLLQVW